MEKQFTRTVHEIDPAAKAWIERSLGHALAEDQTVIVTLPDGKAEAEAWKVAWEGIHRILDRAADNLRAVSDEEFDAAIEEAVGKTRPRPA